MKGCETDKAVHNHFLNMQIIMYGSLGVLKLVLFNSWFEFDWSNANPIQSRPMEINGRDQNGSINFS